MVIFHGKMLNYQRVPITAQKDLMGSPHRVSGSIRPAPRCTAWDLLPPAVPTPVTLLWCFPMSGVGKCPILGIQCAHEPTRTDKHEPERTAGLWNR